MHCRFATVVVEKECGRTQKIVSVKAVLAHLYGAFLQII